MANKIVLKKSSVVGKVPLPADLEIGELAVNLADAKLYSKDASGTVITVGDGGGDVVGPSSSTDNALVRFDGTTGKLIQNSTATLDDAGNMDTLTSKADAFDFDTAATPAAAVGRMSWDDGNGTAQIGLKGGNVTLQVGQEIVARVFNDSGATLTDGQIVYISGSQGNRIAVKLAKADSESTSAGTLGMVTETIANGAEGFITMVGTVNKLNTTGLTAGALIYLSATTAGAYTTTAPTAPNHRVTLGYVERVDNIVGSIYVKVDNGYELDELHNVLIVSPTSGNTLIYDASAGVWKNANITAGTGIGVTNGAGSITISNSGVTSLAGTANEVDVSASSGAVTLSLPATINANTTGNADTATTATNQSGGTVSATTGSFSENVTLSGGTANGVAYLNGSKVLTTGSALTFDGTNLSLLPSGYSVFGSGSTERARITTTGNLLVGTSTDFSSTITAGAAMLAGNALYPFLTGTGSNNTTINSILTLQNTSAHTINSSAAAFAGVSIVPKLAYAASLNVFGRGIYINPLVTSSTSVGRLGLYGAEIDVTRTNANDLSSQSTNLVTGVRIVGGQTTSFPTTGKTGTLYGVNIVNLVARGLVDNVCGTNTTSSVNATTNNVSPNGIFGHVSSCNAGSAGAGGYSNITGSIIGYSSSVTASASAAGSSTTVTDAYAYYTNGIGSTLSNGATSTTIANAYMYYGGTNYTTGGATITNKWGVYIADTAANNYFGGNLGIGTNPPTEKLDVTGNFKLSGSATLTGGTANGVAYLNGSKVLTTGSALTFDGQTLAVSAAGGGGYGNITVGSSSTVDFSTSINLWSPYVTTAPSHQFTQTSGVAQYKFAQDLAFLRWGGSSYSEQMRLTSTGLGIGTSSPAAKLHINYGNTPAGSSEALRLEVTGNSSGGRGPRIDFYGPAGGGTSSKIASIGGLIGYINFTNASSELMRISTVNAGVVGVGNGINNDWASGLNVLQVGAPSAFVNTSTQTKLYSNYYYWNGGSNLIVSNGYYGDFTYDYSNGAFIFSGSSTSGTAGGTATVTERMRIDSSGNVLIGTTTSGASKLVVNSDSIQVNTAKTPASATATGTTGQIAWDADYIYVCVATNTWKRSAIATW